MCFDFYVLIIGKIGKMQASSAFAVKGGLGFDIIQRRRLRGFGELRTRGLAPTDLCMTEKRSCFGLSLNSISMGIELGQVRNGLGSSAKYRSIKAQASTGSIYSLKFYLETANECLWTRLFV